MRDNLQPTSKTAWARRQSQDSAVAAPAECFDDRHCQWRRRSLFCRTASRRT